MSNTADTHAELHGSTDAMRDRIKAFIFPNVPKTEEEVEAFEKAVAYQIEHEKSIRDALEVDDVAACVVDDVQLHDVGGGAALVPRAAVGVVEQEDTPAATLLLGK